MIRIQRKRSKGYRMPSTAKYVGRPTKWGNPFINYQDIIYYFSERRIKQGFSQLVYCCHRSTRDAVQLYNEGLKDPVKLGRSIGGYDGKILTKYFTNILESLSELEGKDLACWCPIFDKDGNPVPCHADVLIELIKDKHNDNSVRG